MLEVIRRFAPVSGFAYVERSAGGAPEQTAMLSLHSAQNDPAAWAEDPNRFLLRPMEEYAAKSVGFAEPAADSAVAGGKMNRNCPAKELALQLASAWFRAFNQAFTVCT